MLLFGLGNGGKEFWVTIWMIGLAANLGPFFVRVNPNTAVFTPHFNKVCDWNSGLFYLHQYLRVSFSAPGCFLTKRFTDVSIAHDIHRVFFPQVFMATCHGNEEGLASFVVRDSKTTPLVAVDS